MTDHTLPHDAEAEAVLIGRLLLDQRMIPIVAGIIGEEDIYTPRYAKAFAGMRKLSLDRRPIDVLTLRPFLDGESIDSILDDISIGHRAPVEEYASIIARLAFRRRVIVGLERVIARAMREEDRNALLAELHDVSAQVIRGADDGRLLSPSQAVNLYESVLAERAASGHTGLPWGFPTLDKWLQPAQGGEMVVIAARPSVGKTALAEHLGDVWARDATHPVLFASLEMSVAQLFDRAVCRAAGITASRIVRGALDGAEQVLAYQAAEDRRDVRVWYLDDPRATSDTLRAAAAKVRMISGGLSAIVVDYLQLLKDAGDTEVGRVTRISRNVKALAREFEVPVLALSQLSRAVEARQDRHPKLHDLRESGAIEQDADRVIGLYRELGTHDLDMEVLKNRSGPVGMTHLWFDPERMHFEEVRGVSA